MKISFIGSGNVACNTAFAVGLNNLCDEIILLDINENFAKGKAIDIEQGFILNNKDIKVIGTTDYSYIKNSDVIVITAGIANQGTDKDNREALLEKNRQIIGDIANRLKEVVPSDEKQPLIIMVTNPLDAILQHFLKVGNFNPKKTVGSGNWLDSSRYKYYLAKKFNVSASKIDAMVVGQHGAKMVYLASQTKINGVPLFEYMEKNKVSKEELNKIFNDSTAGAYEIIKLINRDGTIFGPAISIYDIIESYLKDENKVIPLSVLCNGEYGINNICVGLPTRINRNGIAQIEEYNISEQEKKELIEASEFIKDLLNS